MPRYAAPARPCDQAIKRLSFAAPHTAHTGLASLILRNFDAGAWRSHAEGRWLVAEAPGIVAYFTVQHPADS